MDQSNTGLATRLRHAVVQYDGNGFPESVIGRFQHKDLAMRFLGVIRPVSGYSLELVEMDD